MRSFRLERPLDPCCPGALLRPTCRLTSHSGFGQEKAAQRRRRFPAAQPASFDVFPGRALHCVNGQRGKNYPQHQTYHSVSQHLFLSFGLAPQPRLEELLHPPNLETNSISILGTVSGQPSSNPTWRDTVSPCPICPPWSPAGGWAATLRGRSPTGSHVIQLVHGPISSLLSLNHNDRPPAGRRATRNRALHVSKSTTSILEGDPCARLNVWNASPRHDESQSAAPSRFVPQRGDQ